MTQCGISKHTHDVEWSSHRSASLAPKPHGWSLRVCLPGSGAGPKASVHAPYLLHATVHHSLSNHVYNIQLPGCELVTHWAPKRQTSVLLCNWRLAPLFRRPPGSPLLVSRDFILLCWGKFITIKRLSLCLLEIRVSFNCYFCGS